ncbi:MAG: tRNA (adenosine(37)-N6)-threonylcarbamoyltransferase complex transferase subunit TsaD [bacterium]
MITLGIETSCDETAIGIIEDNKVLANVVSSQIDHTKYGGVVPELAARNHIKVIMSLVKIALEIANVDVGSIDLISVTRGPGLVGALLVGLSFAKALAIGLNKPFIAVNHLEGHIYALQLDSWTVHYPFLVLLVSGGHTEVIMVKEKFVYQTIGRTVDDACGEAFDKVAKMMGLPYPGGPYIEREARKGKIGAVKFSVPKPKLYNFSYSGLKTAVLYHVRDNPEYDRCDIAANFQDIAIEHLIQVVSKAIESTKVSSLGIVGGVSVNNRLREKFNSLAERMNFSLHVPAIQYCTDNAVMVAFAGADRFKELGPSELSVDAVSREALDAISVKRTS